MKGRRKVICRRGSAIEAEKKSHRFHKVSWLAGRPPRLAGKAVVRKQETSEPYCASNSGPVLVKQFRILLAQTTQAILVDGKERALEFPGQGSSLSDRDINQLSTQQRVHNAQAQRESIEQAIQWVNESSLILASFIKDRGTYRLFRADEFLSEPCFNALKENLMADALVIRTRSEQLLGVAYIMALATVTFGNSNKAQNWLAKPKHYLSGDSPITVTITSSGVSQVEEMLIRISEGIYS